MPIFRASGSLMSTGSLCSLSFDCFPHVPVQYAPVVSVGLLAIKVMLFAYLTPIYLADFTAPEDLPNDNFKL